VYWIDKFLDSDSIEYSDYEGRKESTRCPPRDDDDETEFTEDEAFLCVINADLGETYK